MKHTVKILSTITILLWSMGLSAQNAGDFSEDSVGCKENLAVYQLRYKNEEKSNAFTPVTYESWRYVFFTCPRASKNMYSPHGVKMYTVLAKEEKDAVKKKAYVDTVMMIYDRRIQYFGEESRYIGLKGADLFLLSSKEYEKAYEYCRQSFDRMGAKSDAKTMYICFQTAILKYQNGTMPKTDVIALYQSISEAFEVNIAAGKKGYERLLPQIEDLFLSIKPDCDDLVALFEPQFNADPTNVELLKKITSNLSKNCAATDLYFKAAVELDKIEPSAQSKVAIGDMYVAKKLILKGMEYYKEAVDMEEDQSKKAGIYYKMAANSSRGTSISYANKALSLNSGLGSAYILMASKYIEGASDCASGSEFPDLEKWKVYWLAYDMCMKAKQVDPSVASLANSFAANCKSHFPDVEALFGYNVTEGASQHIGCWINMSTTAKVK